MRLEYVSGPVEVAIFEPIAVSVLNHGATTEIVRIRIYQGSPAGSGLLSDTGHVQVETAATYSVAFPAETALCWVQIDADSDFLIPTAIFRVGAPPAILSYAPGDFPIFDSECRRR
jgi:hypothetical protein